MEAQDKKSKFGISKNVLVLGLVSFFNDVASEMIYPLVPIFLTSVLAVPVAVVGLIEGIAESTSAVLKVFSGSLSDKLKKRKPFIVAGYSFSAIAKIVLSQAYVWPLVFIARFIDRFGKGTRTAPRDALIADSSVASTRGRAFGFHRALDTLGAVVGPLLALIAISYLGQDFHLIFFLAFIPAFIGVLLLILLVRERPKGAGPFQAYRFGWGDLGSSFKVFLFISLIFALGNSSDVFLILRARNMGLSVTLVVLAYVLFNAAYAIFSTPAGIVSDKIGPQRVLLAGFLLFSLVYIFFGFIKESVWLWFLFPVYGIYMALTEGVGKAYISNLVPRKKAGTAFGIYQTAVGLTTLFSSLIAGLLWTYIGVSAPFVFGSVMAMLSAILFAKLTRI